MSICVSICPHVQTFYFIYFLCHFEPLPNRRFQLWRRRRHQYHSFKCEWLCASRKQKFGYFYKFGLFVFIVKLLRRHMNQHSLTVIKHNFSLHFPTSARIQNIHTILPFRAYTHTKTTTQKNISWKSSKNTNVPLFRKQINLIHTFCKKSHCVQSA